MLYTLPFYGRNKITSAYGYRTLNGARSFHNGWDDVAVDDKNVRSSADGEVLSSTIITNHNDLTWQWGNYVKVRMGNLDGFFCHMDKRYVIKGQKVTPATTLGLMGNTGYSFGAHTHCEFRNKGKTTSVNPGPVFGLPNIAGVTWDRNAMDECTIGYLDCTKSSYRWRRGPGTTNDLYRDGNGVQMYALTGVTYRVYQTLIVSGVLWCQITPPAVCANVAVPELWVSSDCGTYEEKKPQIAVGSNPDNPNDKANWDVEGNDFVVSVTKGDREYLRNVCNERQLPVRNLE